MSVNSKKMQILIIDDNLSLLRIFSKVLEIKGFSVVTETKFKKGLQLLQKNHFQAAFVDAPLDGNDEKQILTTLFDNGLFSKTAIFLFSSIEFDDSELISWKNNGLYSYLKKPIKRSKILQELESVNSNFKTNVSTSTPNTQSEYDDEEPTSEQFEKLNQLEKQIQELESKPPSDKQESIPKEVVDELSISTSTPNTQSEYDDEEPTSEQFEKLNQLEKQIQELESSRVSESKPIPGKILLQNVINGLKFSTMQSISDESSNRYDDISSINVKETIQKEIQKTLSDLSSLKKEIQSFDVEELHHTTTISQTKPKLTKSTQTKRKLKKSTTASATTQTKRKLKKSTTASATTQTKRKLKKSTTQTKRKLKKSTTQTKRKLKKSTTASATTQTKRKLKKSSSKK